MRLLGNKTKILPHIERLLAARGHERGVAVDVFAGSGAVSRRLKQLGFRVITNDRLAASSVMQMATVQCDRPPEFRRVLALPGMRSVRRKAEAGSEALEVLLEWLASRAPEREQESVITRQYSPAGPAGRMYFREEHARRVDAALGAIRAWRRRGALDRVEHAVLVASVLDAADRVANIAGTYGAWLKHWQQSTSAPWELRPPAITPPFRRSQGGSRAFRADANRLIRHVRADLLYVDPPYNHRQYAANYHVPDVIAEIAAIGDRAALAAYEGRLYGKTGLRPWRHERSAYCTGRGGPFENPCYRAFRDLMRSARERVGAVVISYNEEGILTHEEICAALREFAGPRGRFRPDRDFIEVGYKRFRSDADRAGRRYRVLDGRGRDEVREWLFYARSRPAPRGRARVSRRAAATGA